MVSHAVKALKASKITSELNFRIRLPYACAQLIFVPFIGLHLFVWANPLAFTDRYYQTGKPKMQQQKLPDGKANFSSVMRTLENTADVDGRTEASRRLGGDQNSSYIRRWPPCILCEARSAALLDCHTCGRAAGDQRLGSHSLRRQKRRGAWFRRLRQDQPTRHTIMN